MRKLFYEDVLINPNFRKGNVINWMDSIGKMVHFIYDDIEGDIVILNYDRKKSLVTYKFNDIIYTQASTELKNCGLCNMLMLYFKYNIGDILTDDKNKYKIQIIQKERKEYRGQMTKVYTCKCLKCSHIFERAEYEIKKYWCSCCSGKAVIQGINDIPTTAPWMIEYFQGGYDEAKKYTCNSSHKIYPICPSCGKIKNKSLVISQLYYTHSIGCECSDGKSYPNKFIIEFLRQLGVDFDYEKTFSWASQYRYDAVIYLIDKSEHLNITIEMDGGLGHGGNESYGEKSILEQREEILDDMNKEICSLKNSNYHIRIDCLKSDKDYIKNNILNSKLAEWYDLSNIDWDKCDQFALKNIIKEICDYIRHDNTVNYCDISSKFYISKCTVGRYLKKAKNNGMIDEDLYKKIIWNGKKHSKLYVYNKNKKLIKIYDTASDFVKNSVKDFGFKSSSGGITKSIQDNTFYHNTVYLSYEPLN